MGSQDIRASAIRADAIDAAIWAGSRAVEGLTSRVFYPWTGTRTLDWPAYPDPARTFRVWLEQNELISLTSIVSGGTTMTASDFPLYPAGGPPYTRIEAPRNSSTAFFQRGSNGSQQALALTGVFGYRNDVALCTTLAEALDTTEVGVDVNATTRVGVGTLLQCESERMVVTERSWLTSAQTLQIPLTASMANVSVAVTSGTVFAIGETLLLDSERMLVVDITSNTLTVKRAVDGSVLAAHTGSTIYWPRTLTVERGALGTTAAAHSTSTAVYRWQPPSLIEQLTRGYVVSALIGEESGFTRAYRPSDKSTDKVTFARGLALLEAQVARRYGRNARVRAV